MRGWKIKLLERSSGEGGWRVVSLPFQWVHLILQQDKLHSDKTKQAKDRQPFPGTPLEVPFRKVPRDKQHVYLLLEPLSEHHETDYTRDQQTT